MRRAAILTMLSALALASAVPARAAPTWLAPTALGGGHYDLFSGATNARGDTVLGLRDSATGGYGFIPSAAFRPAGGPTSSVLPLPGATNDYPTLFNAAINRQGTAVLAWAAGSSVWISTRADDAAGFSAPVSVAPITGGSQVDVGIDDDDTIVLAWSAGEGGRTIVSSVVRGADGTLGTIVKSAEDADSRAPAVGMSGDGHAVVAWQHGAGASGVIQAIVRAPGAMGFTAIPALTEDGTAPRAAIADGGDAVIAWHGYGPGPAVQAALRQGDGAFSGPVDLSDHGTYPGIAVNASGQVLVSWSGDWATGAGARLGSVTGSFGPPTTFPVAQSGDTEAALNDAGTGLVTWVAGDANGYAALLQPGQGFAAPVRINPDGTTAAAVGNAQGTMPGLDADGNVLAYVRGRVTATGEYHMYERLYDAAGPHLDGLSIPATATTGIVATFAVAPADLISAVASTSWSFGDGSAPVSGTSVAHAFAAPGSYDVTVTSADAVGNASSATRTVAVDGAAAPAPPAVLVKPPIGVKARVRCRVPSLTNLSATRAKARLVSAHCRLGKVTTPRRLKHRRGLVVRHQSRRAGTRTARGAKVDVTLGLKPKAKKPKRKEARRDGR